MNEIANLTGALVGIFLAASVLRALATPTRKKTTRR